MALKLVSVAIVLLAAVALVAAHGHLTNPTARSGDDDDVRTACSATPTTSVATYTPGSTITVGFNIESTDGGNATFYLSYDGDPANAVAVGPVTLITRTGDYTVDITLGAETCSQCLLEWIWHSGEVTPYYGCATVTIENAPSTTPSSDAVSIFGQASLLLAVIAASVFALAF